MSKMLVGSIDLNKVDKSKIVTKDKDGKPFSNGAKYLNVVVWVNDENDQYGNIASIQENISKEEREKGLKPTYIGNLKDISKNQQTKPVNATVENSNSILSEEEDDLPF